MLNIMYAGNYHVFKGILTSVMSLVKFNQQPIHVDVLTMDLTSMDPKYQPITAAQIEVLTRILQDRNSDSLCQLHDLTTVYQHDTKVSHFLAKKFTPFALLRLYADQVPGIPDKVLYLDADTLILNRLDELWAIDVTDYEFAACKDYFGHIFLGRNMCNSGVLLLNLPKIRETGLFTKTRQMLCRKKLLLADQTALNRLATKKLIIPDKFNSQRRIKPDTVIRHYCASWRFFPVIYLKTVKQWEVDKILKDHRQVYNNAAVTEILHDYQQLCTEMPDLI